MDGRRSGCLGGDRWKWIPTMNSHQWFILHSEADEDILLDLPSIIRSRLCSQRHERMLVAEQCVVVLVSLVFQGRTHLQDSPEAQRFKTQSRNGELSRRYKTCFGKSSCCLPVRGFSNSVNAESYRASKGESAVSKENRQVQPARTAKQHACIVQVSRDAAEKFPHAILVRASCRKTILLLANTCMIDLQWRSC